MGSRLTIACVSVLLLLAIAPVVRTQQNPYRLKEPDQKKLCLECHGEFAKTLASRFVHTPVKVGECSGCHAPHVSTHGKLLSSDTKQMCAGCHAGVVPAGARSTHKVVSDGECVKCHDPHASAYAGILVAPGNDLCISCHQELGAAVKKAKFRHRPVAEGCVGCHAPHGSERALGLLKTDVPALCVSCHKTDSARFTAQHMNYPVATASCTSCHDPHGSDQPALMLNSVHAPVTSRTCNQCHEGPSSPTPFETKRVGYELCMGCHAEMVNATMAKGHLHWPVADQKGCVHCHNPHASKHGSLLKADSTDLCRTCHADTVARIAALQVKHQPVSDGMCVTCHAPHGAEGAYLVDQPSIVALCTTCHDYEQHSAHPIGEQAIDPRNKNLRVDCLSCHTAHGGEHKWMLRSASNVELCTQCHKQIVR
jgi:DmsE family decaheme c-type cytochrome